MCILRDEVLRRPIGLKLSEEEKRKDADDLLIGYVEKGEVIGCCILTQLSSTEMKLRQMVVNTGYQKRGIGGKILESVETMVRKEGYYKISLHARKYAVNFYRKFNYTICSEEFIEVGIPHYKMEKNFL
jgi:predicted GNAT family N-acyltransferase